MTNGTGCRLSFFRKPGIAAPGTCPWWPKRWAGVPATPMRHGNGRPALQKPSRNIKTRGRTKKPGRCGVLAPQRPVFSFSLSPSVHGQGQQYAHYGGTRQQHAQDQGDPSDGTLFGRLFPLRHAASYSTRPMLVSGHRRSLALPSMADFFSGPTSRARLSWDTARLSPMTKYSPSPRVMGP